MRGRLAGEKALVGCVATITSVTDPGDRNRSIGAAIGQVLAISTQWFAPASSVNNKISYRRVDFLAEWCGRGHGVAAAGGV